MNGGQSPPFAYSCRLDSLPDFADNNVMLYRTFGKDKRKVSILGFGCMRLPTNTGKMNGIVNEKEAERIVRY